MKTIRELLPIASDFLEQKKIARAKRDAEELLAAELGCKRIDLYLKYEYPLEERELAGFREKIKRRSSGEPLDYILGEKEFYGCILQLSPAALIPRPETEILMEMICKNAETAPPGTAWDICTGSGCLGLAFKKKFPEWEVALSDLSAAALELARKNAEKNSLQVALVHGDLLAPFHGKRAHLLMANPPYISDAEFAVLDREVRAFEPEQALRGGPDGLIFYRRLSQEAPEHLHPGGLLCLEIGAAQGPAILEIFSHPAWQDPSVVKDWAGHDRFFFCRHATN